MKIISKNDDDTEILGINVQRLIWHVQFSLFSRSSRRSFLVPEDGFHRDGRCWDISPYYF